MMKNMRNVDGVKFVSSSVIVVYNVSKMCIMFHFENSLHYGAFIDYPYLARFTAPIIKNMLNFRFPHTTCKLSPQKYIIK